MDHFSLVMRQRSCWLQLTKAALWGTLGAAKIAILHVIAHKLATTIAKKRKRLDKGVTGSQEPQLKKASVDTGGIDINALIDGSSIVLD